MPTQESQSPAERPRMIVQLQQQSQSKTIHHATIQLFAEDGAEVTTQQVITALHQLHTHPMLPRTNKLQTQADEALQRAVRWVHQRPPTGVSSANRSWSFYFNPKDLHNTFRYDMINIIGVNLRH